MTGMMRLFFFVLVSAGLHAILFLVVAPVAGREVPGKVRTTLVPILKAPAGPPTPPPASKPTPPRTEPADEEKKTAPLPRLTRVTKKKGVDQGSILGKPESSPEKETRAEMTPFRNREAYLRHISRCADQAPAEGLAVPDLVTDDHLKYQDMLEIIRFFGFKVVAYPLPRTGSPSFYLEFLGPDLDRAKRREGKALLTGFSNRARDLTGHPAFWILLTRMAHAHGLDPYHARIAAVVPENIDRYFLYLQEDAARRVGLSLDSVRSTQGRFLKTDVGWVLEIYAVTPISGPTVRTGPGT